MASRGRTPGSTPRRPGVLRWLWYAVSGRLPMRYRDWVLHDLSAPTWPLRHLARLVVPLVPVAVALVLVLPGPWSVRVTAVAMGSVIGLLFSFVFLNESTDRRAMKFGYPSGAAEAARQERRASRSLGKAAEEFRRDGRSRRPPP